MHTPKNKLITIITILFIGLLITGGSYAYFAWPGGGGYIGGGPISDGSSYIYGFTNASDCGLSSSYSSGVTLRSGSASMTAGVNTGNGKVIITNCGTNPC